MVWSMAEYSSRRSAVKFGATLRRMKMTAASSPEPSWFTMLSAVGLTNGRNRALFLHAHVLH